MGLYNVLFNIFVKLLPVSNKMFLMFKELFFVWAHTFLISLGIDAAQNALMKRDILDRGYILNIKKYNKLKELGKTIPDNDEKLNKTNITIDKVDKVFTYLPFINIGVSLAKLGTYLINKETWLHNLKNYDVLDEPDYNIMKMYKNNSTIFNSFMITQKYANQIAINEKTKERINNFINNRNKTMEACVCNVTYEESHRIAEELKKSGNLIESSDYEEISKVKKLIKRYMM